MAITTTAQLGPAVREYYDRLLLMTAYPMLQHCRFAQMRTLPAKSGDTVVFRRYNRLDTVPVPLVDGVTPPGTVLSVNDIKARVSFYGNFVILTNQVELTVEDQVLNQASRLLAQNLAQTMDEVTRDVLVTCSTVIQCSNGTNGNTPTELSQEDIDSVTKTLIGNDAEMISEMIMGSGNLGTVPGRPAFWGIIDSDLLNDLEACSAFVAQADYGRQESVLPGEWGSTKNVRWVYTQVGYVSDASPAVYSMPIVGKEAYAVVNLRSESGEFYVKPLGSAGASDPLNQRGSVGWQHPFVARILNDAFMAILQATAS